MERQGGFTGPGMSKFRFLISFLIQRKHEPVSLCTSFNTPVALDGTDNKTSFTHSLTQRTWKRLFREYIFSLEVPE
jgi:hypothetical protein